MQEYADPVIDWLDAGRGILSRRLFREASLVLPHEHCLPDHVINQSCTKLSNGSYIKDLSVVEQDLSRICLIDNSPISYRGYEGTYTSVMTNAQSECLLSQ
jgi:CTD nuclear envelope phosphatase 1